MALQRRLGRGKASRLCPCSSDVDLFGYGEGVIDLNAEIANCALNLLVPQPELHRPQIAGAAVDECRLVRRRECVPKKLGSSPMLAIHWQTSRAYCRVVIGRSRSRRPPKRYSLGCLL